MEATDLLVLGKKCLVPTDKCFWKAPEDIKSQGVKTRSRTKKELVVTSREHNHYLENKKRIREWILGTETYTMKESDRFYIA